MYTVGTKFILALSLLTAAYAQQPRVLINEILFQPDTGSADPIRTHAWVELYNAGADVSLAGWSVSTRDGVKGASMRPLPSLIFPAGAYLVVHFASGPASLDFSNGSGDYYTGDDPTTPYWNPIQDEAALYSPDTIVDFLSWTRTGTLYQPGSAHDDAVAAKIWTSGAVLVSDYMQTSPGDRRHFAKPGVSLGRNSKSQDTNSPADFLPHGGRNAADISPGRQNLDQTYFVDGSYATANSSAVQRSAASPRASQAKWTVLLYANGDNSLEQAILSNIADLSIISSISGSSSVNFVVQFDGKEVSHFANLDSSGNVLSRTASGGTVRGRIGTPRADWDDPILKSGRVLVLDKPEGESIDLGELDMGDPQTLKDFIQWGKSRYPAEKYALIISSHGLGWKYISPDESSPGSRQDFDALTMSELSVALQGQQFELMVLDACLMGMVEVAHQLRNFTSWLVASEEVVPGLGMAYPRWADELWHHPEWDGEALGRSIVHEMRPYFEDAVPAWGTISLIDTSKMGTLVRAIDTFSNSLRIGAGLLLKRDNPNDNVQNAIAFDASRAARFRDQNYMDLLNFVVLVRADPDIPACAKTGAEEIYQLFDGPEQSRVVRAEDHSLPDTSDTFNTVTLLGGLSIHMPRYRTKPGPVLEAISVTINGRPSVDYRPGEEPYDKPDSREIDGNSMIAIYNSNHDQLPRKTRDMETDSPTKPDGKTPLVPQTDWPSVPSPNLRFVQDTGWSRFLERIYHPTADNHIVKAVTLSGETIDPVITPGGVCGNSFDSITVPVGSKVTLSGLGSSDVDMADTKTTITRFSPEWFFWDLDASKPCVGSACLGKPVLAPSQVPPFPTIKATDIPMYATTNMDEDQDRTPTTWDQKDEVGVSTIFTCNEKGTYVTTLTVWDDNHEFSYHDNKLTAEYVHPQSNSYQSTIECTAQPYLFADILPPIEEAGTPVDVGVGAVADMRFIPRYPLLVTAAPGDYTLTANGAGVTQGAPVQLNADASGTLKLRFVAKTPGTVRATVNALGDASPTIISFTARAPGAMGITDVQVTAPASVSNGAGGSLTATVLAGGKPAANALVTFRLASGAVTFPGGFSLNQGIQKMTNSSGVAVADFRAFAVGPVQVLVSSGGIERIAMLDVPGVAGPPTRLNISGAPAFLTPGDTASIQATVLAGSKPVVGAQVTFQIVTGNISAGNASAKQVTVPTNSQGVATLSFSANDPTPVQLAISVAGTSLSQTVYVPVRLASGN